MSSARNKRLVVSALMLALALVLPYFTGGIPAIGNLLLPMHLPVLLCGFLCGGGWGAGVGLAAPLLRSLLAGRPEFFPTAFSMAFELAAYGLISGLLYRRLPKNAAGVYASLAGAMVGGRMVWGRCGPSSPWPPPPPSAWPSSGPRPSSTPSPASCSSWC